jgi:hypothetical protein
MLLTYNSSLCDRLIKQLPLHATRMAPTFINLSCEENPLQRTFNVVCAASFAKIAGENEIQMNPE